MALVAVNSVARAGQQAQNAERAIRNLGILLTASSVAALL